MGNIFNEAYHHNCVDLELQCRLRAKNLIEFCPEACIKHHHFFCTTPGASKDVKDEWAQKVENWALEDRLELPVRLERLGLRKDAFHYASLVLSQYGFPKVNPVIDLRRKFEEMGIFYQDISVLNIGIGEGNSGIARQLPYFYFDKLTHVEVHKPYIEADRKRHYNTYVEHVHKDAYKFNDYDGYNLILAFDVLEHLTKDKSIKVIDRMKKSGSRILIFGPLEEEPRENKFGVGSQDHLSFWTEQDFKDLGFKTTVLKDFHREDGKMWDAIWAVW
jgi:hypothetical protein